MDPSLPPPSKRLRIEPPVQPDDENRLWLWQTELYSVLCRGAAAYPNVPSLLHTAGVQALRENGLTVNVETDEQNSQFSASGQVVHIDVVHEVFKQLNECYNENLTNLSYLLQTKRQRQHAADIHVLYWRKLIELRAAILKSPLLPVPIPGGDNATNLRFYPAIPNLEVIQQGLRPVVIRQEDTDFWQACIDQSLAGYRVCGVGAPGIGKSTTTFHLLRRLIIDHRRTVVFAVRDTESVYYELKPEVVVVDNERQVNNIIATCHPATMTPERIPALNDPDSYYIADPGKTIVSCDVSFAFTANFIMSASNDERHWGGENFTKIRGVHSIPFSDFGVSLPAETEGKAGLGLGILVFCSPWKLESIISGKNYLFLGHVDDQEISDRYRAVGGSVRAIQGYDAHVWQQNVKKALSSLRDETAKDLAHGIYEYAFSPEAPSSKLVSVIPEDDDHTKYRLVLSSDFVEEQLARKFLRLSWFAVLDEDNSGNRGNVFESFVREKVSRRGPVSFRNARESLGTPPLKGKHAKRKHYQVLEDGISLGLSGMKIVRARNMIDQLKAAPDDSTLFYSKNEQEALIDMIYRHDSEYVAIQVTIQKKHGASTEKIQTLVEQLDLSGDKTSLTIVYVVPKSRYEEFETSPVNPLLDDPSLADKVTIVHVSVDRED